MFGWHDVPGYEFDIEGANTLLDGAGYTWDGDYRIDPATNETLSGEIVVPQGDEVRSQICMLWQNNLKKVGFDLEIREITWANMYDLIRNEETDMIISGWLPDYADPDNYVDSMCGSANAKAIWGSDYKNEGLDDLIDQAKWEPDTTTRNNMYKQCLEMIKEDAPMVWIAQTVHVEAHRLWVKGFYYNPCQSMAFWGISKG
jgi:ABC-type transport system substrate-binding protein